jgi:translation initiation factor 2B subunit (eIF-2B alpha/beta/delta family)
VHRARRAPARAVRPRGAARAGDRAHHARALRDRGAPGRRAPIGGAGEADALRQQVYNPSFDVTPAELVAAIVTEKGVAVKRDGEAEYALSGSSVV